MTEINSFFMQKKFLFTLSLIKKKLKPRVHTVMAEIYMADL